MAPSEPPHVTGNDVVDSFLHELDVRCEGGRGTPPNMAERLKAIRPLVRIVMMLLPPDEAEQQIRTVCESMGFNVDAGEYES